MALALWSSLIYFKSREDLFYPEVVQSGMENNQDLGFAVFLATAKVRAASGLKLQRGLGYFYFSSKRLSHFSWFSYTSSSDITPGNLMCHLAL